MKNVTEYIKDISNSSTVTEVETAIQNIKNYVNNTLGLDPQVQISTDNGKPTVHIQFKIPL